jgi:hypothetical protein
MAELALHSAKTRLTTKPRLSAPCGCAVSRVICPRTISMPPSGRTPWNWSTVALIVPVSAKSP